MQIARVCGLVSVFVITCISFTAGDVRAVEADAQKAVLVTGASTGIGRRITEVLADEGYFVYAGARKQKDLDALDALDNVKAVRLDVTVQQDIDAAVKTVEEGGLGLHGLINNAGVFIGGPLADVPVEEIHWLMDINVYGVVRVTQAFTPLLVESGGRISTIGSISGTLSGRYSGPYSMSKHAVEAFTDSLAAEIEPLGVRVSVIEPGSYNSAIAETALNRMRAKRDQYAKAGSPFVKEFSSWIERDWDRSVYKDPDEVAEAAVHAMSADEPLRRYMVVPKEEEAGVTIGKQIEELVQLNEWQAYSYTRDELVQMLDAALAGSNEGE